MISLYSRHGKHKRIAKFKCWVKATQYIKERFGSDPNNPELKNYFF